MIRDFERSKGYFKLINNNLTNNLNNNLNNNNNLLNISLFDDN